jgi:hypothetical protein
MRFVIYSQKLASLVIEAESTGKGNMDLPCLAGITLKDCCKRL